MTSEEDFQKALDDNPEDWQTRLVFSDWLEERNDPRAEGYRALGANRKVLCDWYDRSERRDYIPRERAMVFDWESVKAFAPHEYCLPSDWWQLLPRIEGRTNPIFESRRAAEDAAAFAFTKLSSKRRAQLLNGGAIP